MRTVFSDITLERVKRTRELLGPLGLSRRTMNVLARSMVPAPRLIAMAETNPASLLDLPGLGPIGHREFIEALIREKFIREPT